MPASSLTRYAQNAGTGWWDEPLSAGYSRRHRLQEKGDLRRLADPQAQNFRRENPDADLEDWERFKDVMESRGEEEKP